MGALKQGKKYYSKGNWFYKLSKLNKLEKGAKRFK